MSETTERPRPRFTGTLRLRPQPLAKSDTTPAPVEAPPPPAAGGEHIALRVADLALCRDRFPMLFDPDRPLPLAIGVREPLAALLGLERAQGLLQWWTGWPPYLAAVAAGGQRYNLDGSEAGAITDAHCDVARTIIAQRAAGWFRSRA